MPQVPTARLHYRLDQQHQLRFAGYGGFYLATRWNANLRGCIYLGQKRQRLDSLRPRDGKHSVATILLPVAYRRHWSYSVTITSATTFPAIGILGFSEVLGVDSSSGSSNGSTTSIQPGALTPGDDNSLLVTAVSFYPSGLPTVSSPFGRLIATDYVASSHIGIGVARVVDMAATSRNPTWSRATAMDTGCTMAVFSPDHDLSRPVSGGIIWGGSAVKSVSRVVTASGGILWGGSASPSLFSTSKKYQAGSSGQALLHLRFICQDCFRRNLLVWFCLV